MDVFIPLVSFRYPILVERVGRGLFSARCAIQIALCNAMTTEYYPNLLILKQLRAHGQHIRYPPRGEGGRQRERMKVKKVSAPSRFVIV